MVKLSARKFRDMVHDAFEKIPVVRDHDQPASIFFQPVFQPLHHLGVQVVRRLVKHKDVCRMDERGAQRGAAAFTARKCSNQPIRVRKTEPRQHALCLIFVQLPEFRRHTGKDLLQHGQIVVHTGVLCKHAHL